MAASTILVVDDNPGMIEHLGGALVGLTEVSFAKDGSSGLEQMRARVPDLVLLDAEMPGMSGFTVLELMKADHTLRDVPVLFITAHAYPEFELKALAAGAVDFIAKPVSLPVLIARARTHLRLKAMADDLRRGSRVDALTGLPNEQGFEDALEREWRRALCDQAPIGLLRVDLDHLGAFNDYYGLAAGDACVRAVAGLLEAAASHPADLVARIDAGSFAVLLPGSGQLRAKALADTVLDDLEALAIPNAASSNALHVTVSIGVSWYDRDCSCWRDGPRGDRRAGAAVPGEAAPPAAKSLAAAARVALDCARRSGRGDARGLAIDTCYFGVPSRGPRLRPTEAADR